MGVLFAYLLLGPMPYPQPWNFLWKQLWLTCFYIKLCNNVELKVQCLEKKTESQITVLLVQGLGPRTLYMLTQQCHWASLCPTATMLQIHKQKLGEKSIQLFYFKSDTLKTNTISKTELLNSLICALFLWCWGWTLSLSHATLPWDNDLLFCHLYYF